MKQSEAKSHNNISEQEKVVVRSNPIKSITELSNTKILQLIENEDKFVEQIVLLNQSGIQCYAIQDYQKAILYLQQAEKVLEYAASCGKTIDRFLIISTLQNEAACYQKLLQLQKSYDYMQAILFNMKTYFQQSLPIPQSSPLSAHQQPQFMQLANPQCQSYKIISSNLHKKICTVVYHLQFAAICSQIDKHQIAIQMAKKTLGILGEIFQFFKSCVAIQENKGENKGEFEEKREQILGILTKYCLGIEKGQISNLCKTVRALIKKIREHSKNDNSVHKLKHFSIGQVMQIHPISAKESLSNHSIQKLLLPPQLTKTFLYTSICFYTIATELRLIAKKDRVQAELTHEFQKSKIFHIFAIKVALQVAPFFSDYHEHIIRSFRNNYHVDLNTDLLEYMEEEKLKESLLEGDSLVIQGSLVQSQQIKSSLKIRENGNLRTRRMSSEELHSAGKKIPIFKNSLKPKKKHKNSVKQLVTSNCMALSRQTLHKQRNANTITHLNENRKTLGFKSQKKMTLVTSRTKLGSNQKQSQNLHTQKIKKNISNQKTKDITKRSQNGRELKISDKSKQKERDNERNRKRIFQEYMTMKDHSLNKKKKNKKNGECSKSKSKSKSRSKKNQLSTPKSNNNYGFKSLRR